jgi:hypothetical protein
MFGKDFITTVGAKASTVVVGSSTLTTTLAAGKVYSLCTNTNTWVKQGFGAQTAAVATVNNVLVPAGGTVFLHGSNGDTVAVIRDTADGACSINAITEI